MGGPVARERMRRREECREARGAEPGRGGARRVEDGGGRREEEAEEEIESYQDGCFLMEKGGEGEKGCVCVCACACVWAPDDYR